MLLRVIYISYFTIFFLIAFVSSDAIRKFEDRNTIINTSEKNSSDKFHMDIQAFTYTSNEISCTVTSDTEPIIEWRDGSGNKLESEDYNLSYIDTITISRITVESRDSNTYTCTADTGTFVESRSVTVLTPFVVHESPEEITEVKHGDMANITCLVTSSFPIVRSWYRQGDDGIEIHITNDSQSYMISPDGTTLFIEYMDHDTAGNYTCEAALKDDLSEKVSLTTSVQFGSFYPPKVTISGNVRVVLEEGEKLSVTCTAIGFPEPFIGWIAYYENPDDEIIIGNNGIILQNEHMDQTKSGFRTCFATNSQGTDVGSINVIVQ